MYRESSLQIVFSIIAMKSITRQKIKKWAVEWSPQLVRWAYKKCIKAILKKSGIKTSSKQLLRIRTKLNVILIYLRKRYGWNILGQKNGTFASKDACSYLEDLPTALQKAGEAPNKLKTLKLRAHRELRVASKEPKLFKKGVELLARQVWCTQIVQCMRHWKKHCAANKEKIHQASNTPILQAPLLKNGTCGSFKLS